jgi:hypothetical protein
VLLEDMIPRRIVHLDYTALRIASLGDDAACGDAGRLGALVDGRAALVAVHELGVRPD